MQGRQGLIIMLNGKRVRMDEESILQFLENLPSDNIEKIELITTPPASFDAEGDAGIINIQTTNCLFVQERRLVPWIVSEADQSRRPPVRRLQCRSGGRFRL